MYLTPRRILRGRKERLLRNWSSRDDAANIATRVEYYCKLQGAHPLPEHAQRLGQHHYDHPSVYFFDTFEYTRYFDNALRWKLRTGDDKDIPQLPCIQKARSLQDDNQNAVLMKLDKVRHFIYTKDSVPFAEKKNKLVFRGATKHKPLREAFLRQYHSHPLCDIGDTCGNENAPNAPRLSIPQQLDFKFILSLEGNDVATNLKWLMSSNSVAVMPPPTCETWFMEGLLQPDVHYICISPDYSDLEERLAYYIAHPEEAERIARNANEWVEQFRNPERENIISLLTLERYLECVNPTRP